MAVNQTIYGSSEQWVSTYYQQSGLTNKNKKCWFGGSTAQTQLRGGIAAGKIFYTAPIDKTLSYCGFGTESALNHRAYIGIDPDNTGAVKIYEYQDTDISNWAFFEKTAQYGETSALSPSFDTGNIRLDDLGRTAWNANINDEWNYSNYLEPYTFVNPHNMVLLINVIAGASLDTSQIMDLATYIQNRASFPYLYTVYGNLYFGTLPERNIFAGMGTPPTGWKTSTLQCLDNYVCQAKNIDIPMYSITYGGSCILMGTPTKSRLISRNNDILDIAYVTEEGKQHLKTPTTNGDSHCYIEYYDNLIEDILKTAACLGLYFTPSSDVAINGALTHSDMYIGILDSSGVGHGAYLRGAQTANAPQADPNFIDMHTVNYDPYPDDPTKYRNDTQFYAGYGTSSFTKFYALTEAQVNTLSQELYRIANDVPSGTSITEYNMKVFLTNNPIDCVISLKKFPVANIPLATSDATIYLGSKATSITDGKILATPTWVYYFNFRNSANTSCRPIFGDNFLDYEPYTKCKIVIPFCGTVDVPVSYIYQYDDLQIALVMDFITGACTAYILVNGITIDSITGSCAIDLPVSGIQSATLDSQIHSVAMAREKQQTTLNTGLIAGAVSIGVGIATGSLPIAIGGGAAIIGSFMHATDTGKQINYELSHMDTPVKQVSAASGQIAHTYDMRCKMVITRPQIADEYSADEYAQTIGFACLENGSVQDFHGFTVANIDLSGINCTAEEKEMIRSAFATGVYLPETWPELT